MAAELSEDFPARQLNIDWGKVLGHERQQQELRRLLAEGRLPHALLLTGPDGVGKKLVGRVTAAAVLCQQPVQGAPCGHCASCRAMAAGEHPDYSETEPTVNPRSKNQKDGRREIRIDDIRALQELAARYPMLSDRRVILLDEVEKMNTEAANSFLKTLEEPPGQVVFILVTSARSVLLDTIISRCMPVAFGVLPRETVAAALRERGAESAETEALSALSDGSLGRAVHLYESDGLALRDEALSFLQALPGLGMKEVWQQAEQMGAWERQRLGEWLMFFNMLLRDILVLYEDGASPCLYHVDARDRLLALLPQFPARKVFALLEGVREMQRRLSSNASLRLQLEGFFIRQRDILAGADCR